MAVDFPLSIEWGGFGLSVWGNGVWSDRAIS